MRDDRHGAWVDPVPGDEPDPRRLGHHDHRGSRRDDRLQDVALVPGRAHEHRVQDDDHRDVEAVEHREHLVAVPAAVDAVFVLHHRDIETVQQARGTCRTVPRPGHQLPDHRGRSGLRRDGRAGTIEQTHHPAGPPGRRAGQLFVKSRRECGEPTLGRRISTKEAVTQGHNGAHLPIGAGRAPAGTQVSNPPRSAACPPKRRERRERKQQKRRSRPQFGPRRARGWHSKLMSANVCIVLGVHKSNGDPFAVTLSRPPELTDSPSTADPR